jgi:hypothetical protein
MTHEEKIEYMRIAIGICGFGMKLEHVDMMVTLYEYILKRKGKTTLDETLNLEVLVHDRELNRQKEALKQQHEKVQGTQDNNK